MSEQARRQAALAATMHNLVVDGPLPALRPTTAQAPAPVRVQVDPQRFALGVASAKALYGRYDGASQTWLIPASHAEFIGGLRYQGLIRLDAPQAAPSPAATPTAPAPRPTGRCPHYTRDQGCPLHGEYCANGMLE